MGEEEAMKYRRIEEHFDEAFKDPKEAVAYLNAVLEDGDTDALLLALAHVAHARGMTNIARHSGLQREGIYKMLRAKGNPAFRNIMKVIEASGIHMSFKAA
jgi:probable addiction module antidote protein